MSDLGKVLAQGQLASSTGVLYTVPNTTPDTVAYVLKIVLVNDDTVARTATLYVGGSGAGNLIMKGKSIDASERVEVPGTMPLEEGQTIQGKADSASKVTYTIFGVESS